ncbi:MAG: nucleotide exchange factor GrpE [Acetobacter sp.]|nr:nucleotide exchange factor GrpE [Bacteroides sp.]MCM1340267.1 nucleotide exchange factor GrpE [Acetobacter sp.]MCM1432783.1 nucleotide exchange factor GrpE [Clostridiales bacterium]
MAKKKNDSKAVNEDNTAIEDEEVKTSENAEASEQEEDAVTKELNDTKEQLLRITAEYANFRKRSEKEKSDSYAYATANVVKELLAVIDNLERALSDKTEDYEGLKKGVQMTYDGLMTSLEKLGVTAYGEQGEQFDPNFHNAIMHVDDDSLAANMITDVFQRGYKLNDKVVRPAMVKTAN